MRRGHADATDQAAAAWRCDNGSQAALLFCKHGHDLIGVENNESAPLMDMITAVGVSALLCLATAFTCFRGREPLE